MLALLARPSREMASQQHKDLSRSSANREADRKEEGPQRLCTAALWMEQPAGMMTVLLLVCSWIIFHRPPPLRRKRECSFFKRMEKNRVMDTSFNTSVISFQYKLCWRKFQDEKELNSIKSYVHTIFVCVAGHPRRGRTARAHTHALSVFS